ncbi:MAG: hypothetical protein IPH20_16290 [Bacteroidales bacterium]|nr:hypothetical protein [Bacteroidales bacterium]
MCKFSYGIRLLLILAFSVFTNLKAQEPKVFSEDPTAFITELSTYIQSSPDRETKAAIQEFSAGWTTGRYESAVQQEIIRTCNLMLNQRMRPSPAFRDYLTGLVSFPESSTTKSYLAWHKGLSPFVNSKSLRQFSGFIETTLELNKNGVLFRSYANSWQFRKGSFVYDFDSTLVVRFSDIDLVCISGKDSIKILQTSGNAWPLTNRFAGNRGKVTWSNFGFDPERVYALLGNYKLNLKQTSFAADTVNFYHKDFFNFPLTGKLEDRVLAGVPLDKATFPRFVSYQTDIDIRQVFKGMDYHGGFTLEGQRIIGSGYGDRDAVLWINRKGAPFIKLLSRNFVIRPDRLVSPRASVAIYLNADSIYHPGLQLRYIDENHEISLVRSNEGASASPYYDSYHNVDMYVEAIYYRMDADSLSFEMLRGINQQSTAIFESSNFYSEERYSKLEGIDEINPINVIYNYTQRTKLRTFLISDLAEFMKKPPEQVKAMVLNLANGGYITYNIDNERIFVLNRLFEYLNARSKKTDYDVIQIQSKVSRNSNAVLDLKTFDMKIRGVPEVSISDSQAVYIYPRDKEILLRKNRDFLFTGLVRAGYFDFYANQSSFEYDKFKLNMPVIDSITFKVDTIAATTKKISQVMVRSVLANLSGELLIDDPGNKSGLKLFPVYPVFISKNDAFVYYDNFRIAKGAYKRDEFYYQVYPFTLDSLNSFTTEGLKFEGHLYSGEMMPDIREPLRVMDDYSLGFTRKLSQDGIPVYSDKAVYYSDLSLSNRGLKGSGSLKFMTSLSESDGFMFYPDSLVADLNKFSIAEQVGPPSFPQVYAEGVHQFWLPALDVMRLSTLPGKEFSMFTGKLYHSGKLSLTSAGLLGKGSSRLDNADIASNTFVFKNQSFNTDTTDFRLYYPERPTISLATRIYPGRVDFKNNIGTFGTPGKSERIELPLSRYISNMDRIEWRMNANELYLTNSLAQRASLADTADLKKLVDFDFTGSEFMSTDPLRDSLQFFAMEATYAMKENQINAREVKMIRVADVAVFPGDGKVTILSDGNMQALKGATIIANRKNKYHRIYDASVNVISRKNYSASGYVDYTDEDGNVQPLFFDSFIVDTNNITYGISKMTDKAGFALSSHFKFTGSIGLKADRQFMTYDGGYRLTNECISSEGPWVAFRTELNPADLRLPVQEHMKDTLGDPVMAAIVYSDFFGSVYPALFEKPKAFGDTLVSSATGNIRYSKAKSAYLIGSDDRLDGKSRSGNLMTLDTKQCIITGEGNIELGAGLGQVSMRTFGKAIQYTVVDSSSFKLSMALDFLFSDQALAIMRENLQLSNLEGVDVNSDVYFSLLNNLLGAGDANELLNELNTTGQVKRLPAQLIKTLTLTDLNMKWDPKLKSYISSGPFGIAGIQKELVNRKVDGYVEIGKRRTGDILNVYIETGQNTWFYFTYGNGIMQVISSGNEFNNILAGIKEDKRTLKGKTEEDGYQYIISTPERRIAFLRKMQSLNTQTE